MTNIEKLKTNENKNIKLFVNTIIKLSAGQGFYGRLLRGINKLTEEELNDFIKELYLQNFNNELDVVDFIEC